MGATFVTGDLFACKDLEALAHGCNCAGAMGAGIAREFRKRYPEMYAKYRQKCANKSFRLGGVFVWQCGDTTIYNLGTQQHWTTDALMCAISLSLTRMLTHAERNRIRTIGLPKIGAGLGGLEWSHVRSVLEEVGSATVVELVVFETYVPGVYTNGHA